MYHHGWEKFSDLQYLDYWKLHLRPLPPPSKKFCPTHEKLFSEKSSPYFRGAKATTLSQQIINCSELEKICNRKRSMFKVNNNDTRTTSFTGVIISQQFLIFLLLTLSIRKQICFQRKSNNYDKKQGK